MNMKRFIAIALIVVMCLFTFFACNNEQPNTELQTPDLGANDTGEVADVETEETGPVLPNLPDDTYFDGYTFTVLTPYRTATDWILPTPREIVHNPEEEAGAPINDAVYQRNSVLSEKFGFELAIDARSNAEEILRREIYAGEDNYDAVMLLNAHIGSAIQEGLFVDAKNLPYIDLDKPWWDSGVEAMAILDRQFVFGGDLLILDNEATQGLLFNKRILQDLGLEFPYDLVLEGKWTFNAFHELIKLGAQDLYGDGVMTGYADQWGYMGFNDSLHTFLVAGGGSKAEKDRDGIPTMTFMDQKNINIMHRAMDFLYDKSFAMNLQSEADRGSRWGDSPHWGFQQGRGMFFWVRMVVVGRLRAMEESFGILPIPKFDENQAQYRTLVSPFTGVLLGVPITSSDLERTSIILEAISAESGGLQRAYYDIVLQRQLARDHESEAMLDILFGTRIYDIGAFYNFGEINWAFNDMAATHDRAVMTVHEERGEIMQDEINKLVEVIKDLN